MIDHSRYHNYTCRTERYPTNLLGYIVRCIYRIQYQTYQILYATSCFIIILPYKPTPIDARQSRHSYYRMTITSMSELTIESNQRIRASQLAEDRSVSSATITPPTETHMSPHRTLTRRNGNLFGRSSQRHLHPTILISEYQATLQSPRFHTKRLSGSHPGSHHVAITHPGCTHSSLA